MTRFAMYAGFGLAPYLITVFVDWGGWNLATWTVAQRFGLFLITLLFLLFAWMTDDYLTEGAPS